MLGMLYRRGVGTTAETHSRPDSKEEPPALANGPGGDPRLWGTRVVYRARTDSQRSQNSESS